MTQILNVPPDLHERLKARADAHGMNLSDFLKRELERMASIPTNAEIFAALGADLAAGFYDAAYVAPAEATRATLITPDRRIANGPGHWAKTILV